MKRKILHSLRARVDRMIESSLIKSNIEINLKYENRTHLLAKEWGFAVESRVCFCNCCNCRREVEQCSDVISGMYYCTRNEL